ncbi:unnamed protein product, partial [marine sediment metagenome]
WYLTAIDYLNNFPGYTRVQQLVDDFVYPALYYDTHRRAGLPDFSPGNISAGRIFGFRLWNDDTVTHTFKCTIYGYLVDAP